MVELSFARGGIEKRIVSVGTAPHANENSATFGEGAHIHLP